jgi:hypothetical protein
MRSVMNGIRRNVRRERNEECLEWNEEKCEEGME